MLDLKVEIPFLGERLGALHIIRLGRGAMVAPGEVARTLPEAAVLTPVDVQLSVDERVGDRHATIVLENGLCGQECERIV